MVWVPKKGECSICGKEITMLSAIQKYCPECRQIMRNIASEEGRKREIARRIAIRRGTDPDRYKGRNTECRYKRSCMYGGLKYCEYAGDDDDSLTSIGLHVNAWMPLPQPYRGEGGEDE